MTDFAPTTEAEWRVACERFLKGKPFEALVRETRGGIERGPLFTRDDLPRMLAALPRTDMPKLEGRPWHILAPVRDPDLSVANAQLLEDLTGGASAVRICAGDGEVPITRRADLRRLLEGVHTDLVPIGFSPNARSEALAGFALDMDELQTAHVRLGLDPLVHDVPDVPDGWAAFTIAARRQYEAGRSRMQELAEMAAILAEGLRRHGALAAPHMIVELSTDQDAHMNIAKLRAARRIIGTILKAFDAPVATLEIHAIGSRRMMQSADPWTNLLRVMTAGFGAVVGGADAVLTRPFTDGYGRATAFGHRIARNMQLLMMEESHLGQVRDAAHGSYWHEAVTEQLAQRAWAAFQQIEAVGGIARYRSGDRMKTEYDGGKTVSDWQQWHRDQIDDETPIIGVTLYPIPDDVPMPDVREA